jgi:hypothetical protein
MSETNILPTIVSTPLPTSFKSNPLSPNNVTDNFLYYLFTKNTI